jgi:hypothetical protein
MRFLFISLCAVLLSIGVHAQDVRISEFQASNITGIIDEDGDHSGWIEIWNPNPSGKVSLANWKLTDGTNTWTFPAVEVMPNKFLLVWASGKNRVVSTAPLHTSFTLPKTGGYLGLIRPANTIASEFAPQYPPQIDDVSYGRDAANPTLTGFYENPSPEDTNNYQGSGVSGKVLISVPSRTFITPLSVSLSLVTADPDAVIRYTTNGSVPTTASTPYTAPIAVTTTQTIRARAFNPALLPGETEEATYLLLDNNSNNFSSAIPIIALTNFGGAQPPADGDQRAYMWVFEPGTDGRARLSNDPTLATRVVIDRRGSSTLNNPKYNLNVEARKARDDDDRNISLLGLPPGSDFVFHAPYDFDRALMRNAFAYGLSNSIGRYAPRTRMAEVFIDTDGNALTYTNAASGNYFGVYNILEKIRRAPNRVNVTNLRMYDNGPVTKTGGYIVKVDRKDAGDAGFTTPHEAPGAWPLANGFAYYEPKEIEIRAPQRLPQQQYITTYLRDMDNVSFSANYKDPVTGFRAYVDVPAAIDHHLLNVWPMNVDAMRLSGYMHKDRGGKIVYGPVWDYDRTLESTDGRDDNPATWRSQVGDQGTDFFNYTWWSRWFTDIDFYQLYIDRWQQLRRGAFSPAAVNALLDSLNNAIGAEAVANDLRRWNQGKRTWTSPFTGQAFTGQTAEVQRIKDWLQQRANFIDSQWVGPVSVTPAEGPIAPGSTVTLAGPNGATIYYTTDGSDPRPPGGAAPTNALTYTGPITIDATTRIRARAYNAAWLTNPAVRIGANNPPLRSAWSGRTDARYSTDAPAAAATLVVTEINYHPTDPTQTELDTNPLFADGAFEFLELRNIGSAPIDLANARFTMGIDFAFTGENALSLAPGEYVIVAANPAAFAARYGAKPNVVGPFKGDLDNNGEQLILVGANNETIFDFTYDDEWYPLSDGGGQSLVIYDQTAAGAAFSTPENWRTSTAAGGSPGAGEAPFVATLDASALTPTSAQLNAEVSGNGIETEVTFIIDAARYPAPNVPATSGVAFVGQTVTGLAPHTSYIVTAEAKNSLGTRIGSPVTFATTNRAPETTGQDLHLPVRELLTFDVLPAATDADSDLLTISEVTQGQFGTVTTDGAKIFYAPAPEYVGNDSFNYTVSDGFGGTVSATVTLHNAAPVATGDAITTNGAAITFDPRINDADSDADALAISTVTQGTAGTVTINGSGLLEYLPGTNFLGRDSFTYTVTDGSAVSVATVDVRSDGPITVATIVKGTEVPGEPAGTTFGELGVPTMGVFSGEILQGGNSTRAIFAPDGTVRLKEGAAAPGIPGAFIKKLGEPSGQAVIATLRGTGITPANDRALYIGLIDGPVALAAREGSGIAGSTLKTFLSIDGNGPSVFFRFKFAGFGVNASNDVALGVVLADGSVRVLAREGNLVLGKPIALLGTLIGAKGTLAENRWRADADAIGVRLTLAGKIQVVYTIPASATSPDEWTLWAQTGDDLAGRGKAATFGLPGFAPGALAYTTQLLRIGAVGKANDTLVLREDGTSTDLLADESGAVPGATGTPLPGLKFKKFLDPVAGLDGRTAFIGTVSGQGARGANRTGLWFSSGADPLRLIARGGESAPGGGHWASFDSLALPDGAESAPVFTATLAVEGGAGITKSNRRGLWAVDSAGTVRLLLRAGQTYTVNGSARVVKTFVALAPSADSLGAARGFDEAGNVTALVTFIDGTQAVLAIGLP